MISYGILYVTDQGGVVPFTFETDFTADACGERYGNDQYGNNRYDKIIIRGCLSDDCSTCIVQEDQDSQADL